MVGLEHRENDSVMKTSVTRIFTFDAAHHLPDHNGKCRNVHGHTYKVEITVVGDIVKAPGMSHDGMIIDFGEVSNWWKESLEPELDHKDLNEHPYFAVRPPTAEKLALMIWERAHSEFFVKSLYEVGSIRVWETPTSYAEISA